MSHFNQLTPAEAERLAMLAEESAAGHDGQATAGYKGTATAGHDGQATAGDRGVLIFLRWVDGRRRVLTAYVGEDGILPNAAYRASDDFKTVVPA